MSDQIKHECGIAFVRLLKPLEYYIDKYGTPLYGLDKMYLLMQKQHNRGQDGAGLVSVKYDVPPGMRYLNRRRSVAAAPIKDIFEFIHRKFETLSPKQMKDAAYVKRKIPFTGELLLGHLRYGTHGENGIAACHPKVRRNNWKSRTLAMAGNFNLTNVDELFETLMALGQHPVERTDTVTILEKFGHFLDYEIQELFDYYKNANYSNKSITEFITRDLNLLNIIKQSTKRFDGGYVMGGLVGQGDAFVIRDPHGIRPAFYYNDDEIVVAASERPAIQTALNVHIDTVKELKPGFALIVKRNGHAGISPFCQPKERKACSFERIYFSRGTDRDIYLERKALGYNLAPRVLKAVKNDFKNTVFSFVPNTAETAFFGMLKGLEDGLNKIKKKKILALGDKPDPDKLEAILGMRVRMEKLAVKDAKLRTFITQDDSRSELVSHVYDVTYGIIDNYVDTIVLFDDSIVRGTTLQQSILKIVARLKPKKIIVVSSAPQIRFPDCYGIDMSKMRNFVAFRALVELIKENGKENLLQEAYEDCKAQEKLPAEEIKNAVNSLYSHFSQKEISAKIAQIVTPEGIEPEVEVIYQTIEALHGACPNHTGDWYFTGNFPTPGGNRVANKSFVYYMENIDKRAY